jgi:hypothetical protein
MKLKDTLAVLAVAAATMAFTVALLGPKPVAATDQPQEIKPTIVQPELTLEIEATNPTDSLVETTVLLSMSTSSPPSPFSRRLTTQQPLWTKDCLVRLQPGQTKTVSLPTEIELPAGENIWVTMGGRELQILARSFSVPDTSPDSQVTLANPAPAPSGSD